MSACTGSGSAARPWTQWVGRKMARIPTMPDDRRGTTGGTSCRPGRHFCCQAAAVNTTKLPVPPPPLLLPPHRRQPATANLLPSLPSFCRAAITVAAAPPPSCFAHRHHHIIVCRIVGALLSHHPLPLPLPCHRAIHRVWQMEVTQNYQNTLHHQGNQ